MDTSIDFLGTKLEIPLIAAPITGCDINLGGKISELEYDEALVSGTKGAGIIGFVGDGGQPELYKVGVEALRESQGFGGAIFKPRARQEDIIIRLKAAEKVGARFVGVDVDAAVGFVTMDLLSQRLACKSVEDLKELVEATPLPFVVKGVMCIEDAISAIKAGAEAIIVSNHGGRITESHPSSISVLEQISTAVKHKVKVILDGGVRSGEDIYKALALGADAVMIGRPFTTAVMGGGSEGVKVLVEKYRAELAKIMFLTGTKDVASIKRESVRASF